MLLLGQDWFLFVKIIWVFDNETILFVFYRHALAKTTTTLVWRSPNENWITSKNDLFIWFGGVEIAKRWCVFSLLFIACREHTEGILTSCLCKLWCNAALGAAQTVPVSSASPPVCQWHQPSEWSTKMRFMLDVCWWGWTRLRDKQEPLCACTVGCLLSQSSRVSVDLPELQTPTDSQLR